MLRESSNIGGPLTWTSALLCLLLAACGSAPSQPAAAEQPSGAQPSGAGPSSEAEAKPEPAETPVLVTEGRAGAAAFADAQARLARGDYAKLLEEADAAIKKNPQSGLAHEVRGAALLGLNRVAEAKAAFTRAIEVEQGQSGPWTKLGIVQMESGEIDDALESLQTAVEINRDDRYAHQRLGLLYEFRGDFSQAVDHLQLGLRGTPPAYLGVAVNLARMLGIQGRHREVIDTLGPRLPQEHGEPIAHLLLATSLYSIGQYEQARQRYERALELDPSLTEATLGLAMALRELGDGDRSLQLLDALAKERPDWPAVAAERGKTAIKMGRPAEAAASFDRYAAMGGDQTRVEQYRAQLQVANKDFAKARDTYEQLIDSGKADVETYTRASELYLSQGDVKRGEQVLREGLAKFPDHPYLTLRLGAYLAAVTRYNEAIPLLEKALKTAPNDASVLRMLMLAQIRSGNNAGALDSARRLYALTKDPEVGVIYAARLEASGQPDAAEPIYREALAANPDNVLALNNLAALLTRSNKLSEAEPLARRAAARAPQDGRILDTLGWVLQQQGRHQEAVETLGQAAKLAPKSGTVRYHYGVALSALGRREEARQALSEAVKLDTAAEWIKDAQSRLSALR